MNLAVGGERRPRIAFPDLGGRIRIRAATHAPPGKRAWVVDVDVSATRTVLAFVEKCVGDFEAFALPLPSGEIVAARFHGEVSMSRLSAGAWKVAPFRVVEAVGE